MSIFPVNSESIRKAANLIRNGEVVAFPTETVYGLGADAFNAHAVAQIFEIKNRPHFDPLIVHIAEKSDLDDLAYVPESAHKLIEKFWPGPLTLVLEKKEGIPDLVVSGLPTVAVRMPSHPAALDLIRSAGTPIAAPSANPFGYLSPTTAEHVREQLGDKVECILDGGACQTGVESTIIDLSGTAPSVLRPGGVPLEEIEKITGPLKIANAGAKPSAPGQLEQHYSPHKPLRILKIEEMQNEKNLAGAAILFWKKPAHTFGVQFEVLSGTGDMREAAANLFSALHRLDRSHADIILAEPVPELGLGLAIMDRLRRAAAGSI